MKTVLNYLMECKGLYPAAGGNSQKVKTVLRELPGGHIGSVFTDRRGNFYGFTGYKFNDGAAIGVYCINVTYAISHII